MSTSPACLIRPSTPADLPQIAAIYAWNVHHGTGTFELDPPDEAEMSRRRDDVLGRGWPWLVAVCGDEVLGYAYANQFRLRPAYRWALEDSIYLAPQALRRGIGRLLLAELLAQCAARGGRQMYAVIGDSANAGSIGVHRACGFAHVGVMHAAGWKFDAWRDVVIMERPLGAGAGSAPGPIGA